MSLEIVALIILVGTVVLVGVFLKASGSSESPGATPRPDRQQPPGQPAETTPSQSKATDEKHNWLIGDSGSVRNKTFFIGDRTGTIGRGVGNFIQVEDGDISRVHAKFDGDGTDMTITDDWSSNGTHVNGDQLEPGEPRPLEDGDEVEIGDATFVYRQSGDYEDQSVTETRNVDVADKETQALGAVGGGDFQQEIEEALERADGDYRKASEELGLRPEMIKQIVDG